MEPRWASRSRRQGAHAQQSALVCVCWRLGWERKSQCPSLRRKGGGVFKEKKSSHVEVLQPLNHSVVLYEFVKYMGMDMDMVIFPGISPRGMCGSQEDAILLFLKRPGFHAARGPDARSNE